MLDQQTPPRERLEGVTRLDRHRSLQDHPAGIHALVDQVHRDRRVRQPFPHGPFVTARTLVAPGVGRVDVDHPIGER